MTPTVEELLPRLKTHLNIEDTGKNAELLDFLRRAVGLLELQPLKAPYADLDFGASPVLEYALFEIVRDMWRGTQAGAGSRLFGADDSQPAYTLGRSPLPPYVLGLLKQMLGDDPSLTPTGSFPAAQGWPDAAAPITYPARWPVS